MDSIYDEQNKCVNQFLDGMFEPKMLITLSTPPKQNDKNKGKANNGPKPRGIRKTKHSTSAVHEIGNCKYGENYRYYVGVNGPYTVAFHWPNMNNNLFSAMDNISAKIMK